MTEVTKHVCTSLFTPLTHLILIQPYKVDTIILETESLGVMFKREGTYVYLWLIHVGIWQKITKFCKSIILQLKNK